MVLRHADRVHDDDLVPLESRLEVLVQSRVSVQSSLFQVIIHDGTWPDLTTLLLAAGIAAATLGVGYAAFKILKSKLVFRL